MLDSSGPVPYSGLREKRNPIAIIIDSANTFTTKQLRGQLKRSGFKTFVWVSLQGPSGVIAAPRITAASLREAMTDADRNNGGRFLATVSHERGDDGKGYRLITVDGYQS